MPRRYLKKADLTPSSGASDVRDIVQSMLDDIEMRGDEAALEYAAKLDMYDGPVKLSRAEIDAAITMVPTFVI